MIYCHLKNLCKLSPVESNGEESDIVGVIYCHLKNLCKPSPVNFFNVPCTSGDDLVKESIISFWFVVIYCHLKGSDSSSVALGTPKSHEGDRREV